MMNVGKALRLFSFTHVPSRGLIMRHLSSKYQKILDKLSDRYKITSNVRGIVEELENLGVQPSSALHFLTVNPHTHQVPRHHYTAVISTLVDYDFTPSDIIQVIRLHPPILSMTSSDIVGVVENLRHMVGLRTSDSTLNQLLTRHPPLFAISSDNLDERLRMFSQWFTLAEMRKIIADSPNVLTESLEDINDRYLYLSLRMGVTPHQMLEGEVFQHPVDHIIERHQILLRSGLYETPDIDGITKRVKNPNLFSIFSSYDRYFLHRVCSKSLTLEELQTFREMIREEGIDRYLDMNRLTIKARRGRGQDDDDEDEDDDNDDDDVSDDAGEVKLTREEMQNVPSYYEVDEERGEIRRAKRQKK